MLKSLGARARAVAGRHVVRDGAVVTIAYVVTIIAGIAGIRVFTELAPASVFGGASLLLGMLTLGMTAGLTPLTQTQVRYYMQYHQAGEGGDYNRLIARYAIGGAFALSVVASVALLVWPALRAGGGIWVVGLIIPWALATGARGALITPVQAERRMQRYAAWISAEAMLLLACTAIALALHPSVEAYIGGQLAGIGLAVLIFGRWPRRAIDAPQRQRMVVEANGQIARYGLPFLTFAVLSFAYGQADRYVLAATLDASAVGKYAAAFAIASRIPSVVGGIMTDMFRPALFDAETNGAFARGRYIFRRWIASAAAVMAVMAAAVFLLGDVIALLVLAAPYRQGVGEVMTLISIGFGFSMIGQIIEIRLLSFGNSAKLIWPKLVGGVCNVAFALLFVPVLGIVGAGLANALGQLAMLIALGVALYLTDASMRPTDSFDAARDAAAAVDDG